jgi:MoaA/NifB/PqqE/SkfB family radical SAM enzyme
MILKEWRKDLGWALGILRKNPFQCLLQLTNRCNMRCSFCDFWPNGIPPAQELTLPDYRRIAGELSRVGRFLVSIEGGEPFLRPELMEIVKIFGADHLPLLYTNGWYLDAKAARALFAAGVKQVGVSIDFPDAKRHDAKRGLDGAFAKACQATRWLKEAAPHGGQQVHVMTVLMKENAAEMEALLKLSASLGVGHCVTLLSTQGFRRTSVDLPPEAPISHELLTLWGQYPHFRSFRKYLSLMDAYLARREMPTCRAGVQSFNIDHRGNVSPCIEKSQTSYGNLREDSLERILERMKNLDTVARCQDCWTLCRGFGQVMGDRGDRAGWSDLASRLSSR